MACRDFHRGSRQRRGDVLVDAAPRTPGVIFALLLHDAMHDQVRKRPAADRRRADVNSHRPAFGFSFVVHARDSDGDLISRLLRSRSQRSARTTRRSRRPATPWGRPGRRASATRGPSPTRSRSPRRTRSAGRTRPPSWSGGARRPRKRVAAGADDAEESSMVSSHQQRRPRSRVRRQQSGRHAIRRAGVPVAHASRKRTSVRSTRRTPRRRR